MRVMSLAGVVLGMVLVACTAPTASPVPPGDTPTVDPTVDALDTPTVDPTVDAVAAPDTPEALEALLPAGLETAVIPGEVLVQGDQRFADLVEGLGADADDLAMAHGSGSGLQVTAVQVRGSDAAGWLEDYMTAHHPTPLEPTELGGKQVLTGPEPDPEYSHWQIYAYAWEDVLFIVQGPDEAAAERLLSELP